MSGSGQAGQRPAASYEPLGLIDTADRERFTSSPPAGADFIALGERWEAELEAPEAPPEYGKRVLGAYQNGRLSASRTIELLWGTVAIEELPAQHPVPWNRCDGILSPSLWTITELLKVERVAIT
jgi:hypothetical protein